MDDFKRFIHPGPECKCCNPSLVIKHPSVECTCCLVAWEESGKAQPLAEWIQSKLEAATIRAAPKPTPKATPSSEPKGFNIIIDNGNVLAGDDLLLFGKMNANSVEETIHHFPKETTFADLMVHFQIFPSKGQARKNGWVQPIPEGWSEYSIGKLKTRLWIWNPSQEWSQNA